MSYAGNHIGALLADAAAHYASKPLLRYAGRDVSHAAVADAVDRATGLFRSLGLSPGDRMLLLAQNKPEWLISLFAALRAGAIVVPVNPALTGPEIAYIVEHSGPRLAVVDAALRGVLPPGDSLTVISIDEAGWGGPSGPLTDAAPDQRVATLVADDPAVMFYTSGTTGRPKGVLLSHGAEIFTARMVADHFALNPTDVSLIASPLSFIYPLAIDFLACLAAGATVILMERFHPEHVLRGIERTGATVFMGVPTMYTMMLEWADGRDVDISSLRFCISAGQNLTWSVASRFRARFGVAIYDLWGQTEGTPITSYCPALEPEGRPGSCGRALPGCGVRIIDTEGCNVGVDAVGEVLLTGPNQMLCYYRNPAATAETLRDGWIHTGDLGRLDADGYLYLVGRKRDLVIRGGANIYPSEVEEAIYGHSAVLECAVIGVPDERYGELVKAFVVVRPGLDLAEADLSTHCRARLADYKLPALFVFVDDLPKGPTGKILKRALS